METWPEKVPGHADIKTFRKLSYPISASVFYGLIGPAGLPADVLIWWDTLSGELTRSSEFRALVEAQAGLVSYQGRAEFDAAIRKAYAEFAKAIGGPAKR